MQRPLRLLLVIAITLGLGGCASSPEAPSGEPDWLQTLRAREGDPIAPRPLQSPDGFFRARVPAQPAGRVEAGEGLYAVSLDIGTTAPVDCWLYQDGIDFASSLSRLSADTFDAIGRRLGEVEARQIDRVDAGAMGESPFLALDWVYRIRAEDGPQVGQVKHLVTSKEGRGLYCQHNEIGYGETFRGIVAALLDSLEYRDPGGRAPYFSTVSTMSIREMHVGVEHTFLTDDGEGATRIDRRTSMLLPVTADTLQVSDTFDVEFARGDGSLINQVHIETVNGELLTDLRLDPQRDGSWSVEGTFQGKPLSAHIRPEEQPSSWLGEAMALRRTLAGKPSGAAITSTRWVPEADPTRLLEGTLTIGGPVGPERFSAKLDAAGLEADLVVSTAGTVASGSVDMGVASLDVEQVYTGGAF